ncbi:GIY-YIG nuclease family protein [candidate division KSB1 bacterium]|nr:GIY-YIG nuclease family protein [candidate division KSB1 bacterium]
MTVGIYCFENLIDGKKYIGQSINIERRYKEHFRNFFKSKISDTDENELLWYSVKKYGLDNFYFYIVEECEECQLDKKEIYYIEKLKSHKTKNGYNICYGGNSPRGVKRSPETIERMRLSRIGLLSGENHPMFGRKHSKEAKDKISRANKGRKRSQEEIDKQKKNRKDSSGKNHSQFGTKRNGSSSKYYGVVISRVKIYKYWVSKIVVNGKIAHIGNFKNEIDAALAYDEYIIKNNLPNPLNFPQE